MSTTFQNALNLSGSAVSISYENKYLGEEYATYARSKTIGLRGILLPSNNNSGISDTFSTFEEIRRTATDSCQTNSAFIINGVNFGTGRVLSVDFSERENPIRLAGYDIQLQVYENSYDDAAVTSLLNSDLKDEIKSRRPDLIESLNENFSFSTSEDGTYEFNHDFSIRYISGSAGYDYVSNAQNLASQFYTEVNNMPDYGLFSDNVGKYNDANIRSSKMLYNESYDLVNLNFSFSKKFSSLDEDATYATSSTSRSIQRDEVGNLTVTENGKIKAKQNNFENAYTQLTSITGSLGTAYVGCNNLFTSVSATFEGGNSDSLFSQYTELGSTINQAEQTIDYNISFTNNPSFTSSGIHEYTQSISEDKVGGTLTISENGSIRPYGNLSDTFDAVNVVSGIVHNSAFNRVNALAVDHQSDWAFANNYSNYNVIKDSLNRTKYSIGYPSRGGQVSYSCEYVANGTFLPSSTANAIGLNTLTVEVSDSEPTLITNSQLVPNVGEVLQTPVFGKQTKLGTRSIKVSAQKVRNGNYLTAPPNINTQLNYMITRAFDQMRLIPVDLSNVRIREMFVRDLNYTFSSQGKIDLNLEVGFVAEGYDSYSAKHVKLKANDLLEVI